MVHGLSLATITRWLGETPFVQVSTIWALTCPATVHQRPCMTREIETWLSDSGVGNNSVVDHRRRWPVLSLLRNCVHRRYLRLKILGVKTQAVEVDAQRHQHTQARTALSRNSVLTVHILFAYCIIQIRPSVKIADWMILYFIKKFIGLPVFPAVYCGYQPPAWKSPHPTPNQPLCFARQTTSSPIWQQLCRQPLGRLAGENIHLTTKSSSKFLNRTNCKWRHKYVTNDDN